MSNLSFNFLDSLPYWHEGLNRIEYTMKHKSSHFRESLAPNHMEAAIWLVETLEPLIETHALRQKKLHVLVLNSWLGIPLVPLLCENLDIASLDLVDVDPEANELCRVFNKHYIQNKFINIRNHTLDTPFAIPHLNAIPADVVIHMSCEQMYPLTDLCVSNPYALYAMQSSNITEEMMGINCVKSADELAKQLDLKTVLAQGMKTQEMYTWQGRQFYDRFQVIGTKNPRPIVETTPVLPSAAPSFLGRLKGRLFGG